MKVYFKHIGTTVSAWCLAIFFGLLSAVGSLYAQQSPDTYLNVKIGADEKLIDWSEILSYFNYISRQSDRISVQVLGKTTLGKAFVMAIITSPENHARMDEIISAQKTLANPYGLNEREANELARRTPVILLVTLNIHSTEIASSQESVELVYELATSTDPEIIAALEETIILLVPSLNPDGQQMVVDWYERNVNTEYDGSRMPWLYHNYAGHDNNRDWFFFNLIESRHIARVLYHDWNPEIILDQHQMGSGGPRLFLPPYTDPVNPNTHPLLTAEVNQVGNHVLAEMTAAGFSGIATGTIFNAYFQGTMSKTPLWHNMIGILTEAASARIATPIFFPEKSIRGLGRNLLDNRAQPNFPDPWGGGWWRLRDIIEYEKALTYSIVKFASERRRQIKNNFYKMNFEAIESGLSEPPYAFVIPYETQDPGAVKKMIQILLIGGVDVERLISPYTTEDGEFDEGDFIISLSQPERPYIIDLLAPIFYPNLSQYPGGPPQKPYDVTGWALPQQFGVEAIPVNQLGGYNSVPFTGFKRTEPLPASIRGYYLPADDIESYKAIAKLLSYDATISFVTGPGGLELFKADLSSLRAAFSSSDVLEGLNVKPVFEIEQAIPKYRIPRRPRIGLYQSRTAPIDEGWTRYVLDDFGFEYQVFHDSDVKENLIGRYDVIILPNMSVKSIIEGLKDEEPAVGEPKNRREYTGGIGADGVKPFKRFVENGGTLIALGNSCKFAIEKLKLPVTNVLKGASSKEFFAPGSFFNVGVNKNSLLTFGMGTTAYIFFRNNPTFRLQSYVHESKSILTYPERAILAGGWLLGEEKLQGMSAMVEIPVGKGRVILYGFRPQHRGQTWGTFRLLFNAILSSVK